MTAQGRRRAGRTAKAVPRLAVYQDVRLGSAELVPDIDRAQSWLLFIDGVPQSGVDLADPGYLEFEYVRRIGHVADLAFPPGQPLRALHLGGGALTLPRYLQHTRPGSRQLVAELDDTLTTLVRTHLPLPAGHRIRVRAADARAVTESAREASYDLVIADVFAGAVTPPHLTTAEFAAAAARALRPGGVYAVNVAAGQSSPGGATPCNPPGSPGTGLSAARAAVATIRRVYRETLMIVEPAVLRGRRRGNLVIVGSDRALPEAALARAAAGDPFPARVVVGADVARFASGAPVITDAFSQQLSASNGMVTRPIRTLCGGPFFYPCPMDLPPSGWYPDPYGTPSLLRWWDGTGWTQHTHPDVTASAHGDGSAPPATTVQGAVAEGVTAGPAGTTAAADGTAVAGTAVQGAVRATTVQPSVAATALQSTTVQPSAQQLSRTKPPTGPPTQPQPALPVDLAAAAYQATTVGSGAFQPTAVQPGYPQPGAGWGPGGGAGGAGTQVIAFGGEPWQASGGPTPGSTNPYGYQEAQRRRRRRLIVGAAAGTLVAIAAIAIIASSLGGSPSTPAADQSPAVPSPTAAAPSATVAASVSASPSASASPSVTASGQVTDAQSGLSYNQLSTPWQATASCPSTLNNGAFPWTDGEYATAGQVNGDGGPVTWYGEACSGPLPQQYYNYTGTADLQTAADSLASTFENAYYNPLDHNITPGQDTPIQVSGHAAWEVSYDVAYPNATAQGATWTDEQAAVVVVDTGTATPAVFFVSIPSALNEGSITSLVSSLQLTAPPSSAQASSQPSTTAPAAGPGGGGDDGGGGNGGGGPNP